mmetsp:Transcript_101224/g.241382  ORF Transcript_101224/g.241382 Transcript_101224/m.241382 type:complete len:204 (+) Transcript_101224:629-1240(+)
MHQLPSLLQVHHDASRPAQGVCQIAIEVCWHGRPRLIRHRVTHAVEEILGDVTKLSASEELHLHEAKQQPIRGNCGEIDLVHVPLSSTEADFELYVPRDHVKQSSSRRLEACCYLGNGLPTLLVVVLGHHFHQLGKQDAKLKDVVDKPHRQHDDAIVLACIVTLHNEVAQARDDVYQILAQELASGQQNHVDMGLQRNLHCHV